MTIIRADEANERASGWATVAELAELIGVDEAVIEGWCDKGLLARRDAPGEATKIRVGDAIRTAQILTPESLPPALTEEPASPVEQLEPTPAPPMSVAALPATEAVAASPAGRGSEVEVLKQMLEEVGEELKLQEETARRVRDEALTAARDGAERASASAEQAVVARSRAEEVLTRAERRVDAGLGAIRSAVRSADETTTASAAAAVAEVRAAADAALKEIRKSVGRAISAAEAAERSAFATAAKVTDEGADRIRALSLESLEALTSDANAAAAQMERLVRDASREMVESLARSNASSHAAASDAIRSSKGAVEAARRASAAAAVQEVRKVTAELKRLTADGKAAFAEQGELIVKAVAAKAAQMTELRREVEGVVDDVNAAAARAVEEARAAALSATAGSARVAERIDESLAETMEAVQHTATRMDRSLKRSAGAARDSAKKELSGEARRAVNEIQAAVDAARKELARALERAEISGQEHEQAITDAKTAASVAREAAAHAAHEATAREGQNVAAKAAQDAARASQEVAHSAREALARSLEQADRHFAEQEAARSALEDATRAAQAAAATAAEAAEQVGKLLQEIAAERDLAAATQADALQAVKDAQSAARAAEASAWAAQKDAAIAARSVSETGTEIRLDDDGQEVRAKDAVLDFRTEGAESAEEFWTQQDDDAPQGPAADASLSTTSSPAKKPSKRRNR